MKKLIAIALALVMVMGLVACGSKPAEGGASASATKVSVFWYDEADVYLSTVRAELNTALEAAGVAYDNQFAAKDQAKQLEQIKTAIAGGSNLLVVNVVTSGDPTSLSRSLTLLARSPWSSSTAPSAPTAPMSPCWLTTLPLASSAPTLPRLATCRARWSATTSWPTTRPST